MWNIASDASDASHSEVEILLFYLGVIRSKWNNASDASHSEVEILLFYLGAIKL